MKTQRDGNGEVNGVYRMRWIAWGCIAAGLVGSVMAVANRGGAVEWFVVIVLSGVAVVSGVAPMLAAAAISVARSMPDNKLLDSGSAEVRLTLRRRYPIPFVWIALQDEAINESAVGDRTARLRTVLIPMFRKEMTVMYSYRQLSRGLHRFSPLMITVGDWLGLSAYHQSVQCPGELIVLPSAPQAGLEEEVVKAGRYSHEASYAANATDDRFGQTVEHEQVKAEAVFAAGLGPDSRPYREGDPLRHLDFRSAAKGRGLQTKVHAMKQAAAVIIAVDQCASAYDGDNRLFDACVGWAADAAQKAAACGHAVTLLTAGWSYMLTTVNEEESYSHAKWYELLYKLALLRADGRLSIAGSLVHERAKLAQYGVLQVYTSDWRGGRHWSKAAEYARAQGCRLELHMAVRNAVPSFAMREQQRMLENSGMKVKWLHVAEDRNTLPYAEEGAGIHAYA